MADRALLRRAGFLALIVAVVLGVAGIFQHGLWTPDEPREAEIAREMLHPAMPGLPAFSALPTLGGEPFLEKPPLCAWITGASMGVFGVSAGAARVPSALFGIGAVWVAYLMGKRAAGRLAGLCSAIALATMWQFSETSHKAVLDVALTFFVGAGHLAFLRCPARFSEMSGPVPGSGRAPHLGKSSLAPYIAIAVLSGLAFLTKAWIGPALLCAPPILAWAAMGDWATVKRVLPRAFVASVLGVAAFGLPWVMALAHTQGGGWPAVTECLVNQSVGRSIGGEGASKLGHANPPWYYTYTALLVLAPWCLALPAMIKGSTLARAWRGGRTRWLGLIFVTGVLLLSVPSGKRDLYLMPLLPAASVPVGVWLSRVGSRRGGAWDAGTVRTVSIAADLVIVAIGIACVYVATAKPLLDLIPAAVRDRLHTEREGCGEVAFVSCLLLVWAGGLGLRGQAKWLKGTLRVAVLFPIVIALVHFGVFPRLDVLRDMSAGSREIAALVPADEKLLALSADETTLATVPFHSGRILANVEDPAEVLKAFDSGATKHLVVMDKDVRKLTPALKQRLDLVKTVRVSATRDVNVYVLKP